MTKRVWDGIVKYCGRRIENYNSYLKVWSKKKLKCSRITKDNRFKQIIFTGSHVGQFNCK